MHDSALAGTGAIFEQELLHYVLLSILQNGRWLDGLVFQGGTALRLCCGAPRLSEGLDFSGGPVSSQNWLCGLVEAWVEVRRNGGSAAVDVETFSKIEGVGRERWLRELPRVLKGVTCAPKPMRRVLIPKKQPGKFRPLGIPCIGDRVPQTSAMLVLEPIVEADLKPEQNACRPERSEKDATGRHRASEQGVWARWSTATCPSISARYRMPS